MDFDGRRPVRTIVHLLAPSKWRLVLATLAFAVKDRPIWLLPLLTANIIDVVVEHRPIVQLWLNASVLAAILLQNIRMHMLMRGRTTFVVAHRLPTIRNADRIVVLTGGRLVEVGTHAELLAAGGLFARLHGLQSV